MVSCSQPGPSTLQSELPPLNPIELAKSPYFNEESVRQYLEIFLHVPKHQSNALAKRLMDKLKLGQRPKSLILSDSGDFKIQDGIPGCKCFAGGAGLTNQIPQYPHRYSCPDTKVQWVVFPTQELQELVTSGATPPPRDLSQYFDENGNLIKDAQGYPLMPPYFEESSSPWSTANSKNTGTLNVSPDSYDLAFMDNCPQDQDLTAVEFISPVIVGNNYPTVFEPETLAHYPLPLGYALYPIVGTDPTKYFVCNERAYAVSQQTHLGVSNPSPPYPQNILDMKAFLETVFGASNICPNPAPSPTPTTSVGPSSTPTPESTATPTPEATSGMCGQSSGGFITAAEREKCEILLASAGLSCKRLDGSTISLTTANGHYFHIYTSEFGAIRCEECPKGQSSYAHGTSVFEGRSCAPLKCSSGKVPSPDGHSCMPKERQCDSRGLNAEQKPITLFRYPKVIDFDTAGKDITLIFPVTDQVLTANEAYNEVFRPNVSLQDSWNVRLDNASSMGLNNQKELVIDNQHMLNSNGSLAGDVQSFDKFLFNPSIPVGQNNRGDSQSFYFENDYVKYVKSHPGQFPALEKILNQVSSSGLGYFISAIDSSYFANQIIGGKKTAVLALDFNGHKMEVKLKLSKDGKWSVIPCGG